MPGPVWLRPGIGGLFLGLFCLPIIWWVSLQTGKPGSGVGLLGGGSGLVQTAITGASWLGAGWYTIALLTGLAVAKMIATSMTIGSGGSAGDFAPSLAIGGLLGGAFGHLASIVLSDATIDPGAFALVGMGVFYGGLAHVPLSSVILVCEMAGSYDLLVPLMLAQGVAFVLLRNRSIYEAQIADPMNSPVHLAEQHVDPLRGIRVAQAVDLSRGFQTFHPALPIAQVAQIARGAPGQKIFPVLNDDRHLVGVITWSTVATAASDLEFMSWLIAMDIMQAPVSVSPQGSLSEAVSLMTSSGLRELPVMNEHRQVEALLTQEDILQFFARSVAPQAE
jgi:CIC family chloride channel protein